MRVCSWVFLFLGVVCYVDSSSMPASVRSRVRTELQRVVPALGVLLLGRCSSQASSGAPVVLPRSFLCDRVGSLDADLYTPGYLAADVYYPPSFVGSWQTSSTLIRVVAPLGASAFGGASSLAAAQKTVGEPLEYVTKFRMVGDKCIADRLYNVEMIAEASLGASSIMDDKQVSSDLAREIHLGISPRDSNGVVFDISLITTDREFALLSPSLLETMERCRQSVTAGPPPVQAADVLPVVPRSTPPPLRKDIETITVYKLENPNLIVARQRTATFLSAADARYKVAAAAEPRVASTAVDVREYLVTYKKKVV